MTRLLLDLPSSSGPSSGQWMVIALGVVTILYVAVVRPLRKGKPRRDPLARPPGQATLAQQRAVERDMGNLLVEYEEMIRRMTAQVDTRAAKLELLIRDAEAVADRLKAALTAGQAAHPLSGPHPAPQLVTDASPPTIAERPGPAATGNPAVAASPDSARIDQRHADVYRLADGGQSARQIARELSRPYGEIELILALRRDCPETDDRMAEPAPVPAEPVATAPVATPSVSKSPTAAVPDGASSVVASTPAPVPLAPVPVGVGAIVPTGSQDSARPDGESSDDRTDAPDALEPAAAAGPGLPLGQVRGGRKKHRPNRR